MKAFRKHSKGFTMIELMVVVIIVGVLAAIAIPLYGRYVRNARTTEATGRIGEIITAAKAWATEHDTPSATWPSNDDLTNNRGALDGTASQNFTYAITAGGGTPASGPLTITATGTSNRVPASIAVTVPSINLNGNPPVISNN